MITSPSPLNVVSTLILPQTCGMEPLESSAFLFQGHFDQRIKGRSPQTGPVTVEVGDPIEEVSTRDLFGEDPSGFFTGHQVVSFVQNHARLLSPTGTNMFPVDLNGEQYVFLINCRDGKLCALLDNHPKSERWSAHKVRVIKPA